MAPRSLLGALGRIERRVGPPGLALPRGSQRGAGPAAGRPASRPAAMPSFLDDGHRAGDRDYLLADWSRGPDGAALSPAARAAPGGAFEALAGPDRAALVLRDVEDLSIDEVAEVLDEAPAAVRSRVHRARMALRESLTRHLATALAPTPPNVRAPAGAAR